MTILQKYPSLGYPEEGYPFPENAELKENILFFETEDVSLHLDILKPNLTGKLFPTIIWVHGGGWRFGDRRSAFERLFSFVQHGFCAVCVDYRKSNEALFPAQIKDLNAAIKWLKANGKNYSIDPNRIGLWGGSSGGHLACLSALTNHVDEFENKNFYPAYDSTVRAVVNMFGPTNLETLDLFPESVVSKFEHHSDKSFEGLLLGGNLTDLKTLVRQASPIHYVKNAGPPFLIMHGKKDDIVPYTQSVEFHKELIASEQSSELILFDEGMHNANNWEPTYIESITQFFCKHLKN